jgi:hypothetical protein
VRVVQGANELRVYLRTWGVERTIPYTRIDILTGADETSLFGALFGKRYKSGALLQVAGNQFATKSRVNTGAGDRGTLMGRVGLIKESFGVDAFILRTNRVREEQERVGGAQLEAFEGSRTDAYVRATFGQPDSSSWFQAIAASMNVTERTPGTGPPPPGEGDPPQPPADTSLTEAQYLFAGGTRLGALGITGAARFRAFDGRHSNELSATVGGPLAGADVAAHLRRDTRDSVMSAELSLRTSLLNFLTVSGSVGQLSSIGGSDRPAGLFAHADVGLRLRRTWLHGGLVLRDSLTLVAPIVFDPSLTARDEAAALGVYARINGPIWRDIHAEVTTIHWDSDGWYRPEQMTRASIYLDSWWLRKFPRRTFHIHAGVTYENRSDAMFPTGAAGVSTAPGHSSITSLVVIRILSAVITWQNRNIRGLEISEIPGLRLPRRLSVYGVRWVLWN